MLDLVDEIDQLTSKPNSSSCIASGRANHHIKGKRRVSFDVRSLLGELYASAADDHLDPLDQKC